MGEARLRSKATTLHPAMALVEEQMSTTAFTPSISAVMQWSSPTQPGTGVGLDARRFGQGLGLCHQGDGL